MSQPSNTQTLFQLPKRYWYLDLVVVAGLVLAAYAVIFLL